MVYRVCFAYWFCLVSSQWLQELTLVYCAIEYDFDIFWQTENKENIMMEKDDESDAKKNMNATYDAHVNPLNWGPSYLLSNLIDVFFFSGANVKIARMHK